MKASAVRRWGGSADIKTIFLRWTGMRAIFHRGYWLAASLYFVVVAHLSPSELVLLGTAMGITLVLANVPIGVWSDAFSRKWPMVLGHFFLGAGMMMTGVVTVFPLLLTTQVLWGLGWACLSGADVAWLTDELDCPDRIAAVLAARARWDLGGGAVGMTAFGVLGWAGGLSPAIIGAGAAMILLGVFVAVWFPENHFSLIRGRRWTATLSVFSRGIALARGDRQIMLVFAATMIVYGAGEADRLFPRRLVDIGYPQPQVLWYTALGIGSLTLGVIALRVIEAHIVGAAPRIYALACLVGLGALLALANAPNGLIGGFGVLLVFGVTLPVTRAVGMIWVNGRVASEVRATMHSFLGQAETMGEIASGFTLALVAGLTGIPAALTISAALLGCASLMVGRSGAAKFSRSRFRSA